MEKEKMKKWLYSIANITIKGPLSTADRKYLFLYTNDEYVNSIASHYFSKYSLRYDFFSIYFCKRFGKGKEGIDYLYNILIKSIQKALRINKKLNKGEQVNENEIVYWTIRNFVTLYNFMHYKGKVYINILTYAYCIDVYSFKRLIRFLIVNQQIDEDEAYRRAYNLISQQLTSSYKYINNLLQDKSNI